MFDQFQLVFGKSKMLKSIADLANINFFDNAQTNMFRLDQHAPALANTES